MSGNTTRIGFANALLSAIGAAHSADALHVVIAWQLAEGQTAGENDPLASLNERDPHGEGGTGNRFSFASIDNALAVSVRQLSHGNVYGSIGDAFRAGKSAPDLITAIGAAGWCGGPRAPCPGYAASIRSNFNRLQDQSTYAREAMVVVGNTAITGAPQHFSESDGITTGDITSSAGSVVGGVVKKVLSPVEALASLAAHLTDPAFWKRAGVFALGAALAAWGLLMLGHGMAPNVSAGVKKAAGAVAGAAAIA